MRIRQLTGTAVFLLCLFLYLRKSFAPHQSLPCVKAAPAGACRAQPPKAALGAELRWHGTSRDGGIAYLNLSLDKQFQRNCTALTTPQSKTKRFLTAPLTQGSLSETGTCCKNRSMVYHRSVYLFYTPRTKCRRIFLSFFPVFPAIDPIFRGKLALKVG